MADPWDRRPQESAGTYELFLAFLRMPDRSLQKLADTYAKTLHNVKDLSARHGWQERARAWDTHQTRLKLEADRDALRADRLETLRRHRAMIAPFQRAMLTRVNEFLSRLDEKGNPAGYKLAKEQLAEQTVTQLLNAIRFDQSALIDSQLREEDLIASLIESTEANAQPTLTPEDALAILDALPVDERDRIIDYALGQSEVDGGEREPG